MLSYQPITGTQLIINGWHIESDTRQSALGINTGQAEFSLKRLVLRTPEPGSIDIELSQLATTSQVLIKNHMISSSTKMTVQDLVMDNQILGPASYDISIQHIDAEFARRLQQEVTDIKHSGMTQKDQKVLLAGKSLQWLSELLEQGPELDINNIRFHFGNEPFMLTAQARVNTNLLAKDAPLLLLLQALNIEATLTIPRSLLAALPTPKPRLSLSPNDMVTETQATPNATQRMDRLVQQGYFTTDGGSYSSKLDFRQGKLKLNGRVFSPTDLLR